MGRNKIHRLHSNAIGHGHFCTIPPFLAKQKRSAVQKMTTLFGKRDKNKL